MQEKQQRKKHTELRGWARRLDGSSIHRVASTARKEGRRKTMQERESPPGEERSKFKCSSADKCSACPRTARFHERCWMETSKEGAEMRLAEVTRAPSLSGRKGCWHLLSRKGRRLPFTTRAALRLPCADRRRTPV